MIKKLKITILICFFASNLWLVSNAHSGLLKGLNDLTVADYLADKKNPEITNYIRGVAIGVHFRKSDWQAILLSAR